MCYNIELVGDFMSQIIKLDLIKEDGSKLKYDDDFINTYKESLISFIQDEKYMHTLKFAKKMLFLQEIQANNAIEGINDDITLIDSTIKSKSKNISQREKCIINLYKGYKYILTNQDINKDSLRQLYDILRDGILETYDEVNLGKYYRTKPVYIFKNTFDDPYLGLPHQELDYYMDILFDFINNYPVNTSIDKFIKSQIMHYYFVYIHPYLDINGRTSRTLSMWYLLKNQEYPYLVFNKAITFSRSKYEKSIVNARERGNLNIFLKYMLESVQKELEKQYIIQNIINNSKYEVTDENYQMLNYFLTMNGNLTLKDFVTIFNYYDAKQKVNDIVNDKINPLIDKGILIRGKELKSYINPYLHNHHIRLNDELLTLKEDKIKYLKLSKYVK